MTLFWIGLALGIAGTLADYLTTRQALAQSSSAGGTTERPHSGATSD